MTSRKRSSPVRTFVFYGTSNVSDQIGNVLTEQGTKHVRFRARSEACIPIKV